MHKVRFLTGVVATGLIAGCAVRGSEVTAIPASVNYVCQDHKTFDVARYPEAGMATVIFDDKAIPLRGRQSAVQEKYTDGYYTLYLDGEKAMLEHNSTVIFGPCTSSVPLPTYYP